jgi:hypothetical protein
MRNALHPFFPCPERRFWQSPVKDICRGTQSAKGREKYGDFVSQNSLDGWTKRR